MTAQPQYKKILLKLSGEALLGDQDFGIDNKITSRIAGEIKIAIDMGCSIAVVVGGGNIFRGMTLSSGGAKRVPADHMGMLATVMNALSFKMALENAGLQSVVMSGVSMPTVCEDFNQTRLEMHLANGKVVIFAGGTGNPYFTTDTAAALRAAEMGADALFKGTQVDGIYSADPQKDPSATRFDEITHEEILSKGLNVMDAAAVSLTKENNIPIVVFSIHDAGQLNAILKGEGHCTLVT